jgi:sigma-B regulation protein RsbU (phosphoserine phosphatase)
MACVGPNPITGMRLSATEGIVGKSVRENVCQTIFDVSQSPDFSHKMDDASGLVTRSILCAPMSFSDQVVGALELINKQTSEGHFSEADAEVLQVLASSAGLAISNQRLAAAQVESERLRRELEVATEIQMGMLPRPLPSNPGRDRFSIHATLRPAREVGGDFYDFFFLDDDRLCFCVGDVSGKGMPAALFMAISKTLLRSIARNDPSPSSIVRRLNDTLSDGNETCMFVTVFLAVLHLDSRVLTYTSAGHNPPYLRRADRSIVALDARHGPVVGVMEEIAYGEDELPLAEGDLLLLYTDGVTEATNRDEDLFSDGRLVEVLSGGELSSVQDTVKLVSDAVEAYELGTPQSDDVTILALSLPGGRSE